MRRVVLCLAVAGALIGATAAVADNFTLNPVGTGGSDLRRDHSAGEGTWTFTVTSLTGRVNELTVAIRTSCPGDIVFFQRAKFPSVGQTFTATAVPAGTYCVVSSILAGKKRTPNPAATIDVTHP
jgi:hypothetical protein